MIDLNYQIPAAIIGGITAQEHPMKKTISFAFVHMSVAFTVGYVMTGSLAVGGALALVEPLVNTVAYFLHEKAWARFGGDAQATTLVQALKKVGKVFETQPGSLMRIGTGPNAASAKHIAMRWSS